jgi:hypothetical protein
MSEASMPGKKSESREAIVVNYYSHIMKEANTPVGAVDLLKRFPGLWQTAWLCAWQSS